MCIPAHTIGSLLGRKEEENKNKPTEHKKGFLQKLKEVFWTEDEEPSKKS